jgi:hypothetical protein
MHAMSSFFEQRNPGGTAQHARHGERPLTLLDRLRDLRMRDDSLPAQLLFYIPFLVWVCLRLLTYNTLFGTTISAYLKFSLVENLCFMVLVVREVLYGRWDRYTLIGFFVLAFVGWNAVRANYGMVLELCIFTFAARDLDFRRLAIVTSAVMAILMVVVITCSQVGVINDVVSDFSNATGLFRHYLGFGSPNSSGLLYFGLTVSYLYARHRDVRFWDYLLVLALCIALFLLNGCRTMLICVVLLVILDVLAVKVMHPGGRKLALRIGSVLFAIAIPAFIIFAIWGYRHGAGWAYAVDQLLSLRISFAARVATFSNILLLGHPLQLPMIDFSAVVNGQLIPKQILLPLDCAYAALPLRIGLISSALLFGLIVLANDLAIRKGDFVMWAIFLAMLVYGASEAPTFSVAFVPMVLLGGQLFCPPMPRGKHAYDASGGASQQSGGARQ